MQAVLALWQFLHAWSLGRFSPDRLAAPSSGELGGAVGKPLGGPAPNQVGGGGMAAELHERRSLAGATIAEEAYRWTAEKPCPTISRNPSSSGRPTSALAPLRPPLLRPLASSSISAVSAGGRRGLCARPTSAIMTASRCCASCPTGPSPASLGSASW
eukprot:scaffold15022_cov117-Isochrysis_galbana.AAC.11